MPAAAPLLWKVQDSDLQVTAPIVAGDAVVFGSNSGYASQGCVTAVNASSGVMVWSAEHPIDPGTLPVATGDLVIASVSNGRTFAFDVVTGATRWSSGQGGSPGKTPTVVQETVFAGSGQTVRALDAASGVARWQYQATGPLFGGVGGGGLIAVTSAAPMGTDTAAVDAATGNVLWHASVGATSSTAWAVTDNAVLLMNAPNTVYGLDRLGNRLWELNVPGSQNGPPITDGDRVLFTADDYFVYAVDAATGQIVWSRRVDAFTGGQPLLLDGNLITTAGISLQQPAVVALDARTGDERWRVPLGSAGDAEDPLRGTDQSTVPLEVDGVVYVGYGSPGRAGGVIAIDPKTGGLTGAVTVGAPVHRSMSSDGQRLFVRLDDNAIGAIALPLPAPP